MTAPQLDRLLTDVGAPVRRVVFARGVEACRDEREGSYGTYGSYGGYGSWRLPTGSGGASGPAQEEGAAAALAALGLRPVAGEPRPATAERAPGQLDPAALAARHGLAPLLLVTATTLGVETAHVVSSVGDVGWRPPLELLYDHRTLGMRVRRLRFLLDGVEHHAARAADGYATAAATARRTAALFGTHDLTLLAGQTTLFVELDALLGAVQRTYAAAGRLLGAAFPGRSARGMHAVTSPATSFDARVLSARSAPPELREALLDAWESHGSHAAAYRRALRARDARDLGQAPVQLARLAPELWAVSIPVTTPSERDTLPRRVDALDRAWAMATDAMRVVSLVVYSVTRDA